MPSRIFSGVSGLNRMGTSKNGIIHTYIYSLQLQYVHLQSCTYILDVSKRGVLGSAVDDIVFFAYFVMFYSSWVDPLVFIGFLFFWRWFSIVFIVYMVQPKVIMPPWWKDMDFKEKNRVPREKSGRHSNLIYLVLKPLKKKRYGIRWLFIIFKMLLIIFQWFFIIFKVFHYFSLIF